MGGTREGMYTGDVYEGRGSVSMMKDAMEGGGEREGGEREGGRREGRREERGREERGRKGTSLKKSKGREGCHTCSEGCA